MSTSISRRSVVQSGAALAAVATTAKVSAQEASPEATPAEALTIPSAGTENQTRGEGGELKLLQWQAPTTLLRYRSTGVKDYLAGSLVMEPLYVVMSDGSLAPMLAAEVPTVEAGTLADDLTWVTVSLKPDLLWSDGEPVTSEDVRFTWEWNVNTENGSFAFDIFDTIADVEIVDDLTTTFRFKESNPIWFETISSSGGAIILPQHILHEQTQEANDAFGISPIGTGPFVVQSFTPNDQATYIANENYREPNKPFFSSVLLKGGGDAAAAARSVLQTGEYDFAWLLNVEPEILEPMMGDESPGTLEVTPTVSLEFMDVNFSDPRAEVNGQKSEMNTPHPILSDVKVREAIALAINREIITSQLYLDGNQPAANVIVGNPAIDTSHNDAVHDPEAAKALLDEAGWVLEDGAEFRRKDGMELLLTLATSVSSIRQKTQAIIQANLAEIGIKIELEQVDAGLFFDGSAGNDQNLTHFYRDLQFYSTSVGNARPLTLMKNWYTGPNGANIAQESNGWSASNNTRWQNAEYDAELEAAQVESDEDMLIERLINLNDMVVNDYAVIPLVHYGLNVGYSKRLNAPNFGFGPFEYHYWNIANWNLADSE